MVLRQVREHEHREPRPLEPALRLRDRGRLHHAGGVAARRAICAEEPLQVERLGRVEPGRPALAADAPLDVREQPGRAPVRLEDRVQQERGGRLPVRAGDRGDVELARRVAEEERRRRAASPRARPARRAAAAPRRRGCSTTSATAPSDGGGRRERVPVARRAAHAEEQRPGHDVARVVGEVERRRCRRSRVHDLVHAESRDEALQVHRAPSLPPGDYGTPVQARTEAPARARVTRPP